MKVAEVDGIEGATEDSYVSWVSHLAGETVGRRCHRKHEFCVFDGLGGCPRSGLLSVLYAVGGCRHPLTTVADAFEILGISPGLVFSEDALREAFREAGKQMHPDAGGKDGEFAALREAFAMVSSPSRRLKHWLELHGTPGEVRGSIDHSLMELFSVVGAVTQRAETVIRKREEAKSSLVRAMLEGETQDCREAVEQAISRVETRITHECSVFPELEVAEVVDADHVSEIARNLAFLEKWRTGLRACFSRLV
jgi:hypothetical protein